MAKLKEQIATLKASADPEWLIDDSTKALYLSLVDAEKQKAADQQAQAKPSRTPRLTQPEKRVGAKRPDPQPEITLSDGRDSSSRFLTYFVLAVLAGALAYEGMAHGLGSSSGRRAIPHHTATSQNAAVRVSGPGRLSEPRPSSVPEDAAAGLAGPGSLTMVPSFIMATVSPKQSATYTLVVNNLTSRELTFEVEGKDLVLKDGKPVYVVANQRPDTIAGSILFSTKSLNVKAGQSASLDLTLTMPAQTQVHGVLVVLKGSDQFIAGQGAALTPSLGALIDVSQPGDTASPGGAAASAHFNVSQWQIDPPARCSQANQSSGALTLLATDPSVGGT
jgi:hypothetical protein